MVQSIFVEGVNVEFPDDASDEEITTFLNDEKNQQALGIAPPQATEPEPPVTSGHEDTYALGSRFPSKTQFNQDALAGLQPDDNADFSESFLRTMVGTNPEAVGEFTSFLGRKTGDAGMIERGQNWVKAGKEGVEEHPARVQSLADISTDSVGDFTSDSIDYAQTQIGMAFGSYVPILSAFGVGATAGAPLGPGGAMASGATTAFGASYVLNFGDIYGSVSEELKDELASGKVTQEQIDNWSASGAGVMAALDLASLGVVVSPIRKMLAGKIAKNIIVPKILEAAAKGTAAEFVTEGAQESIQIAVSTALSEKDPFTEENMLRIADAAVGGGLGGAALGGGGSAVVGTAQLVARDPDMPVPPKDIPLDEDNTVKDPADNLKPEPVPPVAPGEEALLPDQVGDFLKITPTQEAAVKEAILPEVNKPNEPEAVPQVTLKDKPAKPGKQPVFRMSTQEVEKLLEAEKLDDNAKLLRAFGSKERVDRFNTLDRLQNSSSPTKADRGAALMDAEFGDLTPEQERLVYGIGETNLAVDELQSIVKVKKEVDNIDTVDEAANQIMLGIRRSSKKDLAALIKNDTGTSSVQEAAIRIQGGLTFLQDQGLSGDEITAKTISAFEGRGFHPQDAAFIIQQFGLMPKSSSAKVKGHVKRNASTPQSALFPDPTSKDLYDAYTVINNIATGKLKDPAKIKMAIARLKKLSKELSTKDIFALSEAYRNQVDTFMANRNSNEPINVPPYSKRAGIPLEEKIESSLVNAKTKAEQAEAVNTVRVLVEQGRNLPYTEHTVKILEDVARTLIGNAGKARVAPIDTVATEWETRTLKGNISKARVAPIAEGDLVAGFFDPNDMLMMVAFRPELMHNVETIGHEAFHVAQKILYGPDSREGQILKNAYNRLRKVAVNVNGESVVKSYEDLAKEKNDPRIKHKEIQAIVAGGIFRESQNRFGKLLLDSKRLQELPAPVRAIYKTYYNFVERLGNYMNGLGYQSVEDIYNRFIGGEATRVDPILDTVREQIWQDVALSIEHGPAPFASTGRRVRRALKRRVENFKKWFGNSIITNEDGTPREVFHGSMNFFNKFSFTNDIGFHFGDVEQAHSMITESNLSFGDMSYPKVPSGYDIAHATDMWVQDTGTRVSPITWHYIQTLINKVEERESHFPGGLSSTLEMTKAVTRSDLGLNNIGVQAENQIRGILGILGFEFNNNPFKTEPTVYNELTKFINDNPRMSGLDIYLEFEDSFNYTDNQANRKNILKIMNAKLESSEFQSILAMDPKFQNYMKGLDSARRNLIDKKIKAYMANLSKEKANKEIGGFIYKVYVRLENPLRMRDNGWSPRSILMELAGYPAEHTQWDDKTKRSAPPPVSVIFTEREYIHHAKVVGSKSASRAAQYAYLRKIIAAKGYDGIVYRNMAEGAAPEDSFIAFKPTQIKSVHSRAFMREDPDIMASIIKRAKRELPTDFIPVDMTGALGTSYKWLTSVYHIAKAFPEFMPVFMAERKQNQDRTRIINESGVNLTTGKPLLKALSHLSNASHARVVGVLEVARRMGVQRVMRNDEGLYEITVPSDMVGTIGQPGETIILTEEEGIALEDTRRGFSFLIDEIKAGTLIDWGYAENVTLQHFDNLIQQVKDKISTLLDRDARIRGDEILVKLKDQKRKLEELERLRNTDFAPFMRFGNFGYTIKRIDEDGKTQMVWFETYETKGFNRILWKNRANASIKALREKFPESQGYIHSKGPFALTKDNIMANREHMMSFDLLAGLLNSHNQELYKEIRDEILDDLVKKRGFGAHLTYSKNIPGYSHDTPRIVGAYAIAAANYAAKLRNQRIIADSVRTIKDSGTPALYDYARDFLDYTSSPVEELAFVRNVTFMMFLGFNIASAAIQSVTMPIFVGPLLSRFANEATVSTTMAKTFAEVMANSKEYVKARAKGAVLLDQTIMFNLRKMNLPANHKAAMVRFIDRGVIAPMLTPEQAGLNTQMGNAVPAGVTKTWRQVLDVSSALFNSIETASRATAFLTVLRLADADPQFMARANKVLANDTTWQYHVKRGTNNAEELAGMMVDESFGIFGKGNRPKIMRGFGAAFFQFSQYPHMMIELMARLAATQGAMNKKSFVLMAMMLMFFGGWQGLPGAENLKELIEGIWKMINGTDLDIDTEVREAIYDATDSRMLANAAGRGVVRELTGLDVAQRTTLGRIPMADIITSGVNAIAGSPVQLQDVLGTPGNWLIQRPQVLAERWKDTGPGRAIADSLLPQAGANVATALRWLEEGARTSSNKLLVKPEDIAANKSWVMKAIGFNTRDVALAREKSRAIDRVARGTQDLQSDFYRKLAREKVNLIYSRRKNDTADVASRRAKIREINAEIREHNKGRPLNERVILDMDYLSRLTRQLLRDPSDPLITGVPKKTKQRIRKLQTIYMDDRKE